jgi:type IV pilus assembly protein PilO
MSQAIRLFLRIPFVVWFALAGYMNWTKYQEWTEGTLVGLDAQIQQKNAELQAETAKLTQIQEFERQRETKLRELEALGQKFESSRKELPRSAAIPELLKVLADVADTSGLEFSKFTPQAARRTAILTEAPIEVELKGTYLQIMGFLDAAANLTRVVQAQKLVLDSPETRGQVRVIKADASLVTFFLEDAAPPAATPQNPPQPGTPVPGAGG